MVARHIDAHLDPCYIGMRLTAKEFLALRESRDHYELVDGVVVRSPAASFAHQDVVGEILYQIRAYLVKNPIGSAVTDVDVWLRAGLVYRPDLLFLSAEKAARVEVRLIEPPDLVVEIISADSRQRDALTKRGDYEAAGVGEYWMVDPALETFRFSVLRAGAFEDVPGSGERYAATILPGFELDLAQVRRRF